MKLHEGWFSNNEPIPDHMIDSYLNDYLVYNYMRIYNLMSKEQEADYKRLLSNLNTLPTFKDLDKEINKFVSIEAKNQPKENAINTMTRIAKKFGIPDNVLNASIKDFKKNELGEMVYEEASVEKNPYEPGTLQANIWRPSNENIVNEDNEDWMLLWKNRGQLEATEKWTVIRNGDGSWSLKKGKEVEYNFDPNERDEAEEKANELNKELSESLSHNKNETISEYFTRMKKLFTE